MGHSTVLDNKEIVKLEGIQQCNLRNENKLYKYLDSNLKLEVLTDRFSTPRK